MLGSKLYKNQRKILRRRYRKDQKPGGWSKRTAVKRGEARKEQAALRDGVRETLEEMDGELAGNENCQVWQKDFCDGATAVLKRYSADLRALLGDKVANEVNNGE